ncbi:MAG: precorrin-6y C5,15-methyltransferase (decarboxylating) subunit CbiE [Synergistaceae bacterium]|nr:precorrin-6y C5,15-methyltransferase (decarboxylating) subunit CbiE [Synergistaceae bacterium]
MINEITVAGVGSGSELTLTPEVKNTIEGADIIVSSLRFSELIPANKEFIPLTKIQDTFVKIQNYSGKILILVSGDPGLYSLLPLVKKFFHDTNIKVLPGLSSLQILCAYACESWNDAKIFSGHGRELNVGEFLNFVERNQRTILVCDKKFSPTWACDELKNFESIEVFIGSNLGSHDEIFLHGKPSNFLYKTFPELSIMLIKNHDIYSFNKLFLRNSDFLREKDIVITNENVRAAIISKLELTSDSLLWDIGAGSGSISIGVALLYLSMQVYAIEKNTKAVELIKKNIAKFHLHNIEIHEGLASKIIKNLPIPSHVFIGGSGGEMKQILDFITKIQSSLRIVVACVTLENFNLAYDLMKGMKNFETTQISVTSSRPLNDDLTLMKANNPVMILCADI